MLKRERSRIHLPYHDYWFDDLEELFRGNHVNVTVYDLLLDIM